MMSMVMRYAKDEEEGLTIVNDGFLKVFQKISTYKSQGSLQGWIRRIIYHSLSDHFSRTRRYRETIILEEYDHTSAHKQSALGSLYYEDIVKLLDEIPPKSAEVFQAFVIEGYSHKEISGSLGISEGTSRWHVAEAKSRLRTLITNNETSYG